MIPFNEIRHHLEPSTSLKAVGESVENMIHLTPFDNDLSWSESKRNSQKSKKAVVKATPESVAAVLSELTDIDFKIIYQRKSSRMYRPSTFMERLVLVPDSFDID